MAKSRKPAGPVVKSIKVHDITAEDDIQSRDVMDRPDTIADRIETYREVIRSGKKFNTRPVVYEDEEAGKIWLSEGFLRYQAHLDEKKTRMECEVRKGTRLDALINSTGSNAEHGLYRSNADKRRSVQMLLDACPKWNQQKIAAVAGVTQQFVSRVKKGDVQTASSTTVVEPTVETKTVQQSPAPVNSALSASSPLEDRSGVPLEKCTIPGEAPREEVPLEACVIETDLERLLEEESEADARPPAINPAQYMRLPDGSITGAPPERPVVSADPGAPVVGPTDQLGRPLPKCLIDVFDKRPQVKAVNQAFGSAMAALRKLDRDDAVGGFLKRREHFEYGVGQVADYLRLRAAPFCVCPACEGDGDADRCPTCGGAGWLSRAGYEALAPEMRVIANTWGGTPDDPDPGPIDWTSADVAAGGRDQLGNVIPPKLRDDFACDALLDRLRELRALAAMLDGAKSWLHWLKPEAHGRAAQLIRDVEDSIPYAVCVACDGRRCGQCRMSGYHPKWSHDAGQNVKPSKSKKVAREGGGG